MQERFELSHSEAHLARHLTMSGSINDTVQELGITRNTAKTHLRRKFDKTGVNTQTPARKAGAQPFEAILNFEGILPLL